MQNEIARVKQTRKQTKERMAETVATANQALDKLQKIEFTEERPLREMCAKVEVKHVLDYAQRLPKIVKDFNTQNINWNGSVLHNKFESI